LAAAIAEDISTVTGGNCSLTTERTRGIVVGAGAAVSNGAASWGSTEAPATAVTEPMASGFSKTNRGSAARVAKTTTTTRHRSMVVSAFRAPSLSSLVPASYETRTANRKVTKKRRLLQPHSLLPRAMHHSSREEQGLAIEQKPRKNAAPKR